MSRLDSFIRRMSAQRDCLNHVADLLADVEGPVMELGLGNGRTGISRLAWYARVFSGDPEAHMRDVERRHDPEAPARLLNSYRGLASAVTGSAEEYKLWCVASIDVTPQLLSAANDYDGPADFGMAREVTKEVDDLIGRLERAQVRVVGECSEIGVVDRRLL